MRCVASMMQSGLTIAVLLSFPFITSSQAPQKDLFALPITKVKRVNEGCGVGSGVGWFFNSVRSCSRCCRA